MIMENIVAEEIKIICFYLENEQYGLEVEQVLGINPILLIMRVPGVPDFIEGIIKIKGKIIPVIDLRKRFEMVSENSGKEKIIIVKIGGILTGIIVGQVLGVRSASVQNVERPAPVLGQADFLKGVINMGEGVVFLLDLTRLLNREEAGTLSTVYNKVDS